MSRTWLLTNSQGGRDFSRGDVDIVWSDGRPVELTAPLDILDQRIRKTVLTQLKANKGRPTLGFNRLRFLGKKGLGERTARATGVELERMVLDLKSSQAEVQSRIKLDPSEIIDSLQKMDVTIDGTTLSISTVVRTAAGVSVTSSVNEVTSDSL